MADLPSTSAADNEEPVPPRHSLPSYNEPTPETHGRMSREEEAERALKNTQFAPGTRFLLIALFLITILSVPVIQVAVEMPKAGAISRLPMFAAFKSLPAWSRLHQVGRIRDVWNVLPYSAELKAVERTLENDSVVSQWLLPPTQLVLTSLFHAGNEQVYPGRARWLFYRADVDHITGPPFLDPFRLKRRRQTTGIQPDPIRAIVHFRDQLAARGIDLVLMPVPAKPSMESEMFSASAPSGVAPQNLSFSQFKARLAQENVRLFDPTLAMTNRKVSNQSPLYLETDTHWRPEIMESIAHELADFIHFSGDGSIPPPVILERDIIGRGDVAAMLKLPADQKVYPPEKIQIRQVLAGNGVWRPSKDARVLLIGDSFSNVFSVEAMGWGESAGFAEHLSVALRQPIDCILRNSDAAFATREILSNELARGHDRLAGKTLVIWEFAARELSFGDWKMLDLKLGQPRTSRFFNPDPGQEVVVTGTIESISSAPRPGTVPYQDHIIALHLIDISGVSGAAPEDLQAVAYLWSMRRNSWMPAARLRPGDQIKLRLRRWSDVSAQYEKFNRTDLDDTALQLEEPTWGELIER